MKKLLALAIIILFIGVNIILSTGSTSKVYSLIKSNNPPYIPSNPIPDGAFDITICPPNLSWTGGDPDGDNVIYDVYFGKNDPLNMQLIAYNISVPWYQIPFLLDFDTKYYWQVRAEDEYGLTSSGPIWDFRTEENFPPYPPSNPDPKDGANYVLNDSLCWEGDDPNECDNVTYDVYFGDVNPPPLVSWHQIENCWVPPYNLTKFKIYYWRVVSWDSGNLSNSSPIWTFNPGENLPPTNPIIDGPKMGKTNIDYEFTFVSTDPTGHDIKYHIDWGDGNEYETDFYPSGFVVKLNHTWEKRGTYVIQAQVKDIYGMESNWSKYLFKVPKSKVLTNSLFLQIFEQFPKLFSSLRYIFKL